VIGGLGEELEQTFFDHLEIWDLNEQLVVDALADPHMIDRDAYDLIVRLCYRAVWNAEEQEFQHWVDYPKNSFPDSGQVDRVSRVDRQALPFRVLNTRGQPLDLGIRGNFRQLVESSDGNDFQTAVTVLEQNIELLAAKFSATKQLAGALHSVFEPLRQRLGLGAAPASDLARFLPEGGSVSGLIRSLAPAANLQDGLGLMPLQRHGSTLTSLLLVAEKLAGVDKGSVVAIDDFGEAMDTASATHLAATLSRSVSQAWVSTRRPQVAEVFSMNCIVRFARDAVGGRCAYRGKEPTTRGERLAFRQMRVQLLPAMSSRAVVIFEGPHDRSALATLALRLFYETGTSLPAAHAIELLDAGLGSGGGSGAAAHLARMAKQLGLRAVTVIDYDRAAQAEQELENNLDAADVVIRLPKGHAIERALLSQLDDDVIRDAMQAVAIGSDVQLPAGYDLLLGEPLRKAVTTLLKARAGLHSQFVLALPSGVHPPLATKVLEQAIAAAVGSAQGHIAQATGLHPLRVGYDGEGRPITMKYGPDPDTAATRASSIAYVDDIAIAFEGYPPAAKGQVKSTTDAAGRTTTFEYNAQGRVSAQLLPDEPPLARRVEYQYDPAGNVISITPPGRPAHGFGYTPVNLEETYTPPQVTPPLADVETTYVYTPDRQLDLVTRPDGGTIDYQYDDFGRLETLTLDPAGGLPDVHHYAYDDPGGPGDETGNLKQIVTPEATREFSYDGGLPTGEAWSGTGLATASVTQHYDSSFRRDSQQVAIGAATEPAIAFSYDNDDLLTQAGALTLTRDPANGLLRGTSITSGSGTITDMIDYGTGNHFGEVQHYTAKHNGTPFFERAYTRDALGRITSVTETITLPPDPPATTTTYYTYDAAGRLFQVCPDAGCATPTAEYHYDANGNRIAPTYTAQGNVSTTYDAQDRLLSMTAGPTATTYEYTANGELWKKHEGSATTIYTYDALGNLRHVELPDGTAIDYVVDGRNRRIGKKVNGALVRQWVYQDQLEPVAELDGAGNLIAEFIYGSKSHVPDYIVRDGQTYRVISDHLGSVRLVVNVVNASVVQYLDYDAFGVVTTDTNSGWQLFGYGGGLYDPEHPAAPAPGSGFVRFGARDYDPKTARWSAKDPIGFSSHEINLYAYAASDPMNRIDSSGYVSSFGEFGAAVGVNAMLNFSSLYTFHLASCTSPTTSELALTALLSVFGAATGLPNPTFLIGVAPTTAAETTLLVRTAFFGSLALKFGVSAGSATGVAFSECPGFGSRK
jgi:RHS repeat-associated protein